ncbi:MAG: DNA recombination protein RmuC [Chitinophagales bacterium]|nr:DNA recombination protein RmuC [Chitinophagales bacterium]
MEILFLLIGLVIGCALAWLFLRSKFTEEIGRLSERNNLLSDNQEATSNQLEKERQQSRAAENELAKMTVSYENLQTKLSEQKKEVELLQEKFKIEFQNIANQLLEDKSKKFTEQNKQNMDEILSPLKERLKDFEKKVDDTHKETLLKNEGLIHQIKNLKELNQQMSEEARNLTRALKGDTKAQGTWGEVILESILEKSGLTKGREYTVQASFLTEDGRRVQPDVIINLPEGKKVIIDSKVSLVDYEKFTSNENETEKQLHLRAHVQSVRRHIKLLSEKNYQNIYDASPDFVLMFIPIEPAFGLALQTDNTLFQEALEKNIVVISPTTLLATLRTIASMWKQEYQNQNVREIARQAGSLYDKFVSLLSDLEDIGKRIKSSQDAYADAMTKLTGKDNLLRKVERLKELGAESSKTIPQKWLDKAETEKGEEEKLPLKELF